MCHTLSGVWWALNIVFKLSDYLSLTAFELLEFGLAMSWILLLFQNIEGLAQYGENFFLIKIKQEHSNDD